MELPLSTNLRTALDIHSPQYIFSCFKNYENIEILTKLPKWCCYQSDIARPIPVARGAEALTTTANKQNRGPSREQHLADSFYSEHVLIRLHQTVMLPSLFLLLLLPLIQSKRHCVHVTRRHINDTFTHGDVVVSASIRALFYDSKTASVFPKVSFGN